MSGLGLKYYQRCRINVRKSDFLRAISSCRGRMLFDGDEVLDLDVLIASGSDAKLNDCFIFETQRPEDYGKPKHEVLRFRTLENFRAYKAQTQSFYDAATIVKRGAEYRKYKKNRK